MKNYFKLYYILIFTVFGCNASPAKPSNYYSYFHSYVKLPSLDLKYLPSQKPLNDIEEYYVTKDYGKVINAVTYGQKLSPEHRYIYLKSLLHLKEFDKLLTFFTKEYTFDKNNFLEPYILDIALQTLIDKQEFVTEFVSFYNLFVKSDKLFPVDKNKREAIDNMYSAVMNNISLAPTQGGFYYYRYVQSEQTSQSDFYNAIRLQYSDALAKATFADFSKAVLSKNWLDYLPALSRNNTSLYLKVLVEKGQNNALAKYYFNRKRYSSTLKYAPKTSFYYHASVLVTAKKQNITPTITYAKNNLNNMFFYLSYYYYYQRDFNNLNRLFEQKYGERSLRFLIVLGLDKKEYQPLYQTLKKLEVRDFSRMGSEDRIMLTYWLGFLEEYFNNTSKSLEYYIKAASKNPNLYYGWQSFKAIPLEELSLVSDNWQSQYATKKTDIKQFISKINALDIDKNDLNWRRGFFFMRIREDIKGKLYLQKFLDANAHNKIYLYYALALGYYENHRLIYYSFYMNLFLNQLQNVIGGYLFFEDLLPLLFPRHYTPYIEQAAEYYKLKPSIIESLILQESAYDYLALSWVGAQGLSQLMPSTGAPIIKKLYAKKIIENEDVWDPKTNIFVGSDYMNWLMNTVYKGYAPDDQLALAYASYNAGPKRIKNMYHRMENMVNLPHFIESIDFEESRRYVQKLTFSKDMYAFLYHVS